MTWLLVAAGAFAGTVLRFGAAHRLGSVRGTLLVNVAGSFLLGLFSALALGGQTLALLGTGFCGGLTTFSAYAVQAHALGRGRGSAYLLGTVVLALVACWLGFWAGSAPG